MKTHIIVETPRDYLVLSRILGELQRSNQRSANIAYYIGRRLSAAELLACFLLRETSDRIALTVGAQESCRRSPSATTPLQQLAGPDRWAIVCFEPGLEQLCVGARSGREASPLPVFDAGLAAIDCTALANLTPLRRLVEFVFGPATPSPA